MSNPWFQFYHSDWISGTRRLSPTTRAIYIDILCMIYSASGPIERDDVGMAKECAVTLGTFTKSLLQLLSIGKLKEVDGKIFNEKAAKNIEKSEKKSRDSSRAANKRWDEFNQSLQSPPDATALPPHDNGICDSDAPTTTPTTIKEVVELSSAREVSVNLERRLREAAGWGQRPEPSLFITGPIQSLLDAGADLEVDVLPTIQSISKRCDNPNWKFFIAAIARARDTRLAALTIKTDPQTIRQPNAQSSRNTFQNSFAIVHAAIDDQIRREAESGSEEHGEDVAGLPRLRQIPA